MSVRIHWILYGLCLLIILLVGSRQVARRLSLGRQVRTHAICQSYVAHLRLFQEQHGRFPDSLVDAVPKERLKVEPATDAWGHPLHYESDGNGFVLASLGEDGKMDAAEFAKVNTVAYFPREYDICGVSKADEVVSHLGWHTQCGK